MSPVHSKVARNHRGADGWWLALAGWSIVSIVAYVTGVWITAAASGLNPTVLERRVGWEDLVKGWHWWAKSGGSWRDVVSMTSIEGLVMIGVWTLLLLPFADLHAQHKLRLWTIAALVTSGIFAAIGALLLFGAAWATALGRPPIDSELAAEGWYSTIAVTIAWVGAVTGWRYRRESRSNSPKVV